MNGRGSGAARPLVDLLLVALLFLFVTGVWAYRWVPPLVGPR